MIGALVDSERAVTKMLKAAMRQDMGVILGVYQ